MRPCTPSQALHSAAANSASGCRRRVIELDLTLLFELLVCQHVGFQVRPLELLQQDGLSCKDAPSLSISCSIVPAHCMHM